MPFKPKKKPPEPKRRRRPRRPKPGRTERCMSCDLGVHHPGRRVAGCKCGTCQGGTG